MATTSTLPSPPSAASIPPSAIVLTIELSGGLESIFPNNTKHHTISLPLPPPPTSPTVDDLVQHMASTLLAKVPRARRDLFAIEDAASGALAVRPGILVLVNDADWELEGEGAAVLAQGDVVCFVSTLHGG